MEVSVALFLLSVLLSSLFSFLNEFPKADRLIREKKQAIFADLEVHTRLRQILSKCPDPDHPDFLFTFEKEKNRLIWHFDQGIDKDPSFGGIVEAVLYRDKDNNLCLGYISLEDRRKKRKEILSKNITSLKFSFFYEETLRWEKTTKPAGLPVMVKLKVGKENFFIDYAHIFPQYHPVKYGA